MDIDNNKIDAAVLALLFLTLQDNDQRTWKSHDWDAMSRLHEGYISNPVGKAKSVRLTDGGLRESERLFRKLFSKASISA